jgi:hypothetical protein
MWEKVGFRLANNAPFPYPHAFFTRAVYAARPLIDVSTLSWHNYPSRLEQVMGDLERILQALEQSGARYLIVGGVAVVLHGYPRFTADLDLVLALDSPNVLLALRSLHALGYKPRAPVPVEQFADEEIRKSWIEEKGLVVFSLWSSQFPVTQVDLFVQEPFPFEEAYARALRADLGFATVTVASIADLIELKRRAGRAKDLEDIEALERLEKVDNEP